MSFWTAFLLILAGLIVSAHARLTAVLFGQPVSVSALDLIALLMVLTLVAAVLFLVRLILRECARPVPEPVYVVTTLT
jgi:ABC-type Mn2+/Zn2+ transport system permease subunit